MSACVCVERSEDLGDAQRGGAWRPASCPGVGQASLLGRGGGLRHMGGALAAVDELLYVVGGVRPLIKPRRPGSAGVSTWRNIHVYFMNI